MTEAYSIVLVDDDEDDLFILTHAFKELGEGNSLRVKSFTSGKELLESLNSGEVPNIIILDYTFPLETALDIVKVLRRMPLASQPRILIWSATASSEDAEACLAAGADWFMRKPVGYSNIVSKAARLVEMWLRPA